MNRKWYMALLHNGDLRSGTLIPHRDWVWAAYDDTIEDLRRAYRETGADESRVQSVSGAVLVLEASYAVIGLDKQPLPITGDDVRKSWVLPLIAKQGQIGERLFFGTKKPVKHGRRQIRVVVHEPQKRQRKAILDADAVAAEIEAYIKGSK